MKRLAISGADRHPDGGEHLIERVLSDVGGVQVGEPVILYLEDEPHLEADAVIEFFPGWGSGWFGRRTSNWRDLSK